MSLWLIVITKIPAADAKDENIIVFLTIKVSQYLGLVSAPSHTTTTTTVRHRHFRMIMSFFSLCDVIYTNYEAVQAAGHAPDLRASCAIHQSAPPQNNVFH